MLVDVGSDYERSILVVEVFGVEETVSDGSFSLQLAIEVQIVLH